MRWVVSSFLALALACGSEPPRSAPVSNASQGNEREADQADGKWHHFWIVRQARDAVIHGDLTRARTLLARISDGHLLFDHPTDWTVWIEEMQDEADRAERAKGVHDLAQIVAAIASRCGDCHRSVKGRPRTIPLATLEQMAHGQAGGRPRNADHAWAAEELWVGMTVPVHQAWVRGSQALTQSPLHASDEDAQAADVRPRKGKATRKRNAERAHVEQALFAGEGGARPRTAQTSSPRPQSEAELKRGLQDLVRVGEELHRSGRPLIMARAYGNLIERCASCHQGASSPGVATQAGPADIGPVRLADTR